MVNKTLEGFFKNRNLAYAIDALAKRYGKMPYEVVTQQSLYEFNFNIAVMTVANIEDNKEFPKATGKDTKWGSFGVSRTIVKKGKENG